MTGCPIPSTASLAALKAERDRLRTKLGYLDLQIASLEFQDRARALRRIPRIELVVPGIPEDELLKQCISIGPWPIRRTHDHGPFDAAAQYTAATPNAY